MPEFGDLLRNYTSHAGQALPPIIARAAASLGIEEDDERARGLLAVALAQAYLAGADAGQTEVLAQAVEQGVDINVRHVHAPQRWWVEGDEG
ncbi:hypothetical protein [Conexibacter sp. SYSU D00693]|uniref:hypothetical protein n=1 Tax=Conexibacter sp. SYSU D00693 TaxID=2812560 RepID=UPI00196B388B|nr:hypothetical protein [Conexibacter sp. SYSU D00693]